MLHSSRIARHYKADDKQLSTRFAGKKNLTATLRACLFTFICMVMISQILVPSAAFAASSEPAKSDTQPDGTYLLDRIITWDDGSKEHVQIGTDGFFRVNGNKTRLIGIDFRVLLSYDEQGIQYWVPDRLALWEKELAYLESLGMRIVTFDPSYLRHWPGPGTEQTRWSSVFDLIYKHKMLVMPHIEGKDQPGFGNLENPNFGLYDPSDTMGAFANRFADTIANYPNVVAVVLDNELNLPQQGQNYTPAAVQNYLNFLATIIRTKVNVPLVQNLVGEPDDRLDIMKACLSSTDWPCFTLYGRSVTEYNTKLNTLTTWLRDNGYPAKAFWIEEANKTVGDRSMADAAGFNTEYIREALDNGASVVFLHCTHHPTISGFNFFDSQGNPIQSLATIGAQIPILQAPIPELPSVSNLTGVNNITASSARLNGQVTSTGNENPTVHIYWSTADGGATPANWAHDVNLGIKPAGVFNTNVSGLAANTTYYYRSFAQNSAGSVWASSSDSFITSPAAPTIPTVTTSAGSAWASSSASFTTPPAAPTIPTVTTSAGSAWASSSASFITSPAAPTIPTVTTASGAASGSHDVNQGIKPADVLSTDVSGVTNNTTNNYSSVAQKSAGSARAAGSTTLIIKKVSPSITIKLIDGSGKGLSGGVIEYYGNGWKTIGTTPGKGELVYNFPESLGTYNFRCTYAGASQAKSQNIATNPIVVFQTGTVHSDSGSCTNYYAGDWKTFSQDLQLLPGTYNFRFKKGTADKNYSILANTINHVH